MDPDQVMTVVAGFCIAVLCVCITAIAISLMWVIEL